ncbi:hypothetical protein DB345_20620 [Spartobacteria bacterium LR76]|nr:hypothetical protein DB345_20620 [Spartobacteria bacterium LR76]
MPNDLPPESQNRTLPGEVLDLILAGYWDWCIPENTEYLSPEFKRMFGYEDHELPNCPETWQRLIFPEDLPRIFELFQRHVESQAKVPFDLEVRYRHRDGSTVWVMCKGKVIEWSDTGAPLRMVGCHIDITHLKRQEAALRESETRWKFALEGAGDGVWDWDAVKNTVFYSPQWKAMLGYDDEDIGDSLDEWSTRVHPDDMPRVLEEIDRHISGKTPVYSSEHRVRCKDGSYKWVLDRGQVISRAPDGSALRIIGTHSDISERKAQAAVMEQLSLVAANTVDGVIITDLEGRVEWVNESFCRMSGYSLHETLGKKPGDFLQGSGTDPAAVSRIGQALRHGEKVEETLLNYAKSGRPYYVHLRIDPVRDIDGRLSKFIALQTDVTDQMLQEKALRESRESLRLALEASGDGIWDYDPTTKALYLSLRCKAMLGYADDEIGNTLSAWESLVHPDDLAAVREEFQLHVSGEVPIYSAEYRMRCKDGSYKWVLDRGRVLDWSRDHRPLRVIGTHSDVSKVKRIEQELRDAISAQQAAFSLLEAAGRIARVGHWELKMGDNQPIWSDVTCDIHEVAHGTRVDLETALDFYLPEDRQMVAERIRLAVANGEPFEFEARIRTAKGNLRWIQTRGEPVTDPAGIVIALRGVFQDIDDRHRAAELLEKRNRELEAATERAQANAKAKAEFLANMSHEIRTPLNAVIGMSELLSMESLDPHQREFVDTIHNSGDMLLAIINDILDFSKIESGQFELESIPMDIRECIESAIDIVSPQAARKELEILCWIDPALPSAMIGDPVRLRQIFVNLLTNAVKFTPQGEVRIKLTKRSSGGALVLRGEVKDSGIGIPTDRASKLFQAFSQIDSSTTRRFGGTGLGLVITQRLLQMMDGRIWVESEMGKGSVFRFEIPIQATNIETAAPSASSAEDLAGLRVLIVDDNPTNLGILKMQVRSWGMSATLCKSAQAALEIVRNKAGFDLAIFDFVMPEMDGYQLSQEVRKLRPSLPILLLTSIGLGKRTSAESLGVSVVLSKPIKIRPLQNAIRAALRIGVAESSPPSALISENLAEDCPLRILVAEDNAINQRVADLLLRRLGYSATFVTDGLLALDALARSAYDVVLLDIQMPEMDGLEATREICRRFAPEDRPWLVALTAHATDGDRDECLAIGMNDYLSKPVRREALSKTLRRAYLHKAQ